MTSDTRTTFEVYLDIVREGIRAQKEGKSIEECPYNPEEYGAKNGWWVSGYRTNGQWSV
jgi:hypothetical protein